MPKEVSVSTPEPGSSAKNAGISCRPARAKLRSVKQGSNHYSRANRPDDLGNFVYLGEVFANERNQSALIAQFHEPDRLARDIHGFPPANVGVKCAAEMILVDLSFIERPAVVFVLADVKPLLAGRGRQRSPFFKCWIQAHVHPVARELPRLRWALADTRNERSRSVA